MIHWLWKHPNTQNWSMRLWSKDISIPNAMNSHFLDTLYSWGQQRECCHRPKSWLWIKNSLIRRNVLQIVHLSITTTLHQVRRHYAPLAKEKTKAKKNLSGGLRTQNHISELRTGHHPGASRSVLFPQNLLLLPWLWKTLSRKSGKQRLWLSWAVLNKRNSQTRSGRSMQANVVETCYSQGPVKKRSPNKRVFKEIL